MRSIILAFAIIAATTLSMSAQSGHPLSDLTQVVGDEATIMPAPAGWDVDYLIAYSSWGKAIDYDDRLEFVLSIHDKMRVRVIGYQPGVGVVHMDLWSGRSARAVYDQVMAQLAK